MDLCLMLDGEAAARCGLCSAHFDRAAESYLFPNDAPASEAVLAYLRVLERAESPKAQPAPFELPKGWRESAPGEWRAGPAGDGPRVCIIDDNDGFWVRVFGETYPERADAEDDALQVIRALAGELVAPTVIATVNPLPGAMTGETIADRKAWGEIIADFARAPVCRALGWTDEQGRDLHALTARLSDLVEDSKAMAAIRALSLGPALTIGTPAPDADLADRMRRELVAVVAPGVANWGMSWEEARQKVARLRAAGLVETQAHATAREVQLQADLARLGKKHDGLLLFLQSIGDAAGCWPEQGDKHADNALLDRVAALYKASQVPADERPTEQAADLQRRLNAANDEIERLTKALATEERAHTATKQELAREAKGAAEQIEQLTDASGTVARLAEGAETTCCVEALSSWLVGSAVARGAFLDAAILAVGRDDLEAIEVVAAREDVDAMAALILGNPLPSPLLSPPVDPPSSPAPARGSRCAPTQERPCNQPNPTSTSALVARP